MISGEDKERWRVTTRLLGDASLVMSRFVVREVESSLTEPVGALFEATFSTGFCFAAKMCSAGAAVEEKRRFESRCNTSSAVRLSARLDRDIFRSHLISL